MRFGLSETQKLLQETILRFGEKEISAKVLRATQNLSAPDLVALQKDFDALGMGSMLLPESFGGADGSLLDMAVIQMALGQFVAPVRFLSSAVLLPLALKEGGTAAQQEKYFPLLASSEIKVAIALEAGGVKAANNQLTGEKNLAFDVEGATLALVACGDEVYLAPLAAATAATAAAATAGSVKDIGTIDTTRSFGRISFQHTAAEKLTLPAARLVAAAHIVLAADMVGVADSMMAQAIAYAKTREQFNRVIASFQAVKHECAEMVAALEPVRSQVWLAAHSFDDEPHKATLNALLTKTHSSKVCRAIARSAIEIFGGFGFTDEANLHFWFKRIGANYQMLGHPEILCEQAAALQFDVAS